MVHDGRSQCVHQPRNRGSSGFRIDHGDPGVDHDLHRHGYEQFGFGSFERHNLSSRRLEWFHWLYWLLWGVPGNGERYSDIAHVRG